MKKIILLFVSVIFLLVSCNDNKGIMFRYSGRGVNPTSLHHGAMSDDGWIVTRGDGTQRIEVLYECYDKIEWLDFDELK